MKTKKCNDCLARFTGEHTCPPWLKAIVRAKRIIAIPDDKCEECDGDGFIEVMGDGENFENDVVGTRPCKACQDDNYPTPAELGVSGF